MPTRIKGKTILFSLEGEDYKCDASSVLLTNEEGAADDVVTFCDAETGATVQWFFEVSALTSTDADSLWTYVWDNSGEDVAFVFAPHGNATPTATQPHFTGTLNIGPKPSIGGQSNTTFVFDKRFDLVGEPTKIVA